MTARCLVELLGGIAARCELVGRHARGGSARLGMRRLGRRRLCRRRLRLRDGLQFGCDRLHLGGDRILLGGDRIFQLPSERRHVIIEGAHLSPQLARRHHLRLATRGISLGPFRLGLHLLELQLGRLCRRKLRLHLGGCGDGCVALLGERRERCLVRRSSIALLRHKSR